MLHNVPQIKKFSSCKKAAIEYLASGAAISEAAAAVGVTSVTVHRWKREAEFDL